ncbi:iron(III) transport system permease protein [Oribacterium sp. KHPX15]|uniref:ABC transporter permease n=1 Tax=Oribacterium sp. KHPX15 TaxID=1855342 RepID=UPI0008987026|nr:iron ABC transporter permease [Oribacterium sp. KHPX15]SEA79192.1 iron(III) transport system permease protein [Oribacterium sp. KHPX15]
MTCRKYFQYSKITTVCLVYMLLTFLPVICFMISGRLEGEVSLNARRAGLMVNSFVIAFFTVAICLMISVFASLWIYTEFSRRSLLRWFFLTLAPVPPYIYALSYMNFLRFMGRYFPEVLRYRMAGIFPCVVVETFVYLPFACAAALIALDQVNEKEWSAALLFDNADKVFFKVIFPKQLPWLLAIGAIIFVLSITDYSIPSLFQVNVYSMEIFSDYSAAGQSVHSLYLSFPLMLTSAVVIIFSLLPLKNISYTMKAETGIKPAYSKWLKAAGVTAVLLTLLQIILPIISFIPSMQNLGDDLISASSELWNSCISGLIAVLILTVPSAAMALLLSKDDMSFKTIVWVIAVLPLCIPGVLTGIGVLKLFSSTSLYVLRNGALFPGLGLAIRYMPFAVLIQYGCYLRIDRDRIRAAKLLQNHRGSAFLRVQLPLMVPGLIIAGITVFLLALGDVGTSLVLMMPGREPMSVKIYNYLHYGSSEKVTAFCMMQMVVSLVMMGTVCSLSKWFQRRNISNG